MSKRWIIILSFIVPIVVAGLVVLGLWLFSPNQGSVPDDSNNQNNNSAETFIPDTSVDYGACSMTSKELISSAFSGALPMIKDGFDMGKVATGTDGDSVQPCAYYLSNDDSVLNSVQTIVYKYENIDNQKVDASSLSEDAEAVDGIADSAVFYSARIDNGSAIQYTLRVDRSSSTYVFSVTQPADEAISRAVAMSGLETIAKSADYPES